VLDHKPWAVEDGEEWVAAFAWQGEPVDLSGSELTVGPGVTVELAPAGEQRRGGRSFARPPRADVLETELAAAREKSQQLSRDLHTARADHAAELVRTAKEHEEAVERARAESATAAQDAEHRAAELHGDLDAARDRITRLETALQKARNELAVARADAASHREGLERERAALAAEASKAAAGEVGRLRQERDAARREADNANTERDAARRESASARGERDAAIRDRDRARRERQVLLTRVRSEGEKRRSVQPPSATPKL
jgi:chromosome segregation ATPase